MKALSLFLVLASSAIGAVIQPRQAAVNAAQISNFTLLAQYAGAAYCNSRNAVGATIVCANDVCPTVQSHNVVTYASFLGSLSDIQGFVAIDNVAQLIVVSFRGSNSGRNVLADLLAFQVPASGLGAGLNVHSGFYGAWTEIRTAVLNSVSSALTANPSYTIATTGHSLGGALSILAGAYLRQAHPSAVIDVYSYGSPRVGNEAFATFATNQARGGGGNFRVTHLDDPVPRLPPLAFGYRHTSPEYWLSDGAATQNAYQAGDVRVCTGYANVACNAAQGGVDVSAHGHYFVTIGGCGPAVGGWRRDLDRLGLVADEEPENGDDGLDWASASVFPLDLDEPGLAEMLDSLAEQDRVFAATLLDDE